MKIVQVHSFYRSTSVSGEDLTVKSIHEILKKLGHDAHLLSIDGDSITKFQIKFWKALKSLLYIPDKVTKSALSGADIVIMHNSFPVSTPYLRMLIRKNGTKFVRVIHNYRKTCLSGNHFYESKNCFKCRESSSFLTGVLRKCYRNSFWLSILVAHLTERQSRWEKKINACFVAVSMGISSYLSENGYRDLNIVVIPNFTGAFPLVDSNVSDFYFLGRLVPEKGIVFLTDFWKMHPQLPKLHVIGGGPLLDEIKKSVKNAENIEIYGPLFGHELEAVIANCKAIITPNIWQEPFGRVIVEAWARGQIVLTTDLTNFLGQSQFFSFRTLFSLSRESMLTAILHTIENSLPIAQSEAVAFWADNFAEAVVSKKWNDLLEKLTVK